MINYIKEKIARYYYGKGVEMYSIGNYASANSFFNKALRIVPKHLQKKMHVMVMVHTIKF